MPTPDKWVRIGAEIIRAEQTGEPSPLLPVPPCQHPKDGLYARSPKPGHGPPIMEFRSNVAGATFDPDIEIYCRICDSVVDFRSPVARDAVAFYLANRPSMKLVRQIGADMFGGTRRPALADERMRDG